MEYSDSREKFFWSFCQNVRDKPSGDTDVMYFKLIDGTWDTNGFTNKNMLVNLKHLN